MTSTVPGDALACRTVGSFLADLSERLPTPGGGAAAGLHVAQAAALVAMVGRYTTGPRYTEHAGVVARVVAIADDLRAAGLQLADADSRAFAAVSRAYALPRDDAGATAARRAAVAAALAGAAGPPVGVIHAAASVIDLAEALLPVANRSVITDVAAASEAARAAATTARLNVEINLRGIEDGALRTELEQAASDVDDLCRRAGAVEESVRASLR